MPNTPEPRSYQAILNELVAEFVFKTGVNDLNTGSVIRSLLEAAAASDFRTQGSLVAALNITAIDRASGVDLDNLGLSNGVERPAANVASGFVTIGTSLFTKISTTIYPGALPPPIGFTSVDVVSVAEFPASGSIYIGRDTENVEGPLAYTSITPIGSYFRINLSTPTTKNHNINESVVLAQGGDRLVVAGTTVQTSANALAPSVVFTTSTPVTLRDGEDSLSNVPVVAATVGTIGNVEAGAITEFPGEPFNGATVTNPLAFVTGADVASDEDYRQLIKNTIRDKTQGTDLAIENAAIGVTSSDDNSTVQSVKSIKPSNQSEPGILYVDDGSLYQPLVNLQGFERLVDNAAGGEQFIQLQNEDITKALLISSSTAPFALTGGMKLAVEVGGVFFEHEFIASDFDFEGSADVFEVVNSINANTTLAFNAKVVDSSSRVMIFAKNFENEDLKVTSPTSGTNANDFLGFGSNLTYTLRLYKNDELLIKDGQVPTITSNAQSSWSTIVDSDSIGIKVDFADTFASYTVVDADFIPFGFSTVSETNSLASWASVLNQKILGVTVTVKGNRLKFVSNRGADNDGYIAVDTSSAIGGSLFGTINSQIEDQGFAVDYYLNRSTGQVELATPLSQGDTLTAGTENFRAFVDSAEFSTGTVTLGSSNPLAQIWIVIDDEAENIAHTAIQGSTLTITESGDVMTFTSSVSGAFSNVQVGDWVIMSDTGFHTSDPNLIGAWLVTEQTSDSYSIKINNFSPADVTLVNAVGLSFARASAAHMQKIDLTSLSGSTNIADIINVINDESQNISAESVRNKIRIRSNTINELVGSIFIAGFTDAAAPLGYAIGQSDSNTLTHSGFVETSTEDIAFPEFLIDTIATGSGSASAPGTSFTSTTSLLGDPDVNKNQSVAFLDPFNGTPTTNLSSNKGLYTKLDNIIGTSVSLRSNPKSRDILDNDRYYISNGFNFGVDDDLFIIVDRDSVNQFANVNFSRQGTVYGTPTQTVFQAYDAAAGSTANYPSQFGDNFSFEDYKVHFRARQKVIPAGVDNQMLVRAAVWGPGGEKIQFGLSYPTSPNSALASTISQGIDTNISVSLASGVARSASGWSTGTEFDVTNPGGNTFRYTYTGTGSTPDFLAGGTPVLVGDVVSIRNSSPFLGQNSGSYKVTAVTSTWFEITNYDGVVESAVVLDAAADLRFFPLQASNTALTVVSFINDNLSTYITAENEDIGTGVVDESTYDTNAGSSRFVRLADGENYISSSSIGTVLSPTNQFTLKNSLSLVETLPYTLSGETFYLIPTTVSQVVTYLNFPAVTPLSLFANIESANNAERLQISSQNLGSQSTVLVSGGDSNSISSAALDTGSTLNVASIVSSPIQKGLRRTTSPFTTTTATTTTEHNLSVGDLVAISNSGPEYNGTFTVTAVTPFTFSYTNPAPTAYTATLIDRVSSVSTTTTSTNHDVKVGDLIRVASASIGSFNGDRTVTSVTSNTITYDDAPTADVASISYSGSTATLTTSAAHLFNVGDTVSVSSVGVNYNGSYILTSAVGTTMTYTDTPTSYSVFSIDRVNATSTVTLVTTGNHNMSVGDSILVAGVTDVSFNGSFTLLTASGNTMTYTQAGVDASDSTGNVSATGTSISGGLVTSTDSSVTGGPPTITDIASGGGSVQLNYGKYSISSLSAAASSLKPGEWVKWSNSVTQAKVLEIDATSQIEITSNNIVTLTAPGSFQEVQSHSGIAGTEIKVEKVGQFLSFIWTGTGTDPDFTATEGSWVVISGNFATGNEGTYKVVSMNSDVGFFIELPSNYVEEEILMAAASDLVFYTYDSVMPGDELLIGNDVLGVNNNGSFIVDSVTSSTEFVVSGTPLTNIGPTTLGAQFIDFVVKEAAPFFTYKKVFNTYLSNSETNRQTIIVNDTIQLGKINVSSGSVFTGTGRFGFPATIQIGEDAYKHYGGIIHEVGRVIRGQPSDPARYPGVAASGSFIEIDSPIGKKVEISLSVRNVTGIPFSTIKSRIQSAVASYVNNLGIGEGVVFAEILSAVQQINGVQASVISSPTFDSSNEDIPVQNNEKAVILDQTTDVSVALIT